MKKDGISRNFKRKNHDSNRLALNMQPNHEKQDSTFIYWLATRTNIWATSRCGRSCLEMRAVRDSTREVHSTSKLNKKSMNDDGPKKDVKGTHAE